MIDLSEDKKFIVRVGQNGERTCGLSSRELAEWTSARQNNSAAPASGGPSSQLETCHQAMWL